MTDQQKVIRLSAAEYQKVVASDPCLQFMERVNQRATNRADWNSDYTRAYYYAHVDEANEYLKGVLERQYGECDGFSIEILMPPSPEST